MLAGGRKVTRDKKPSHVLLGVDRGMGASKLIHMDDTEVDVFASYISSHQR